MNLWHHLRKHRDALALGLCFLAPLLQAAESLPADVKRAAPLERPARTGDVELANRRVEGHNWQTLFNGSDLSGWTPMNDGVFLVTNRCLRLVKGMGWLRSERACTNFVFEAEWRALQTNYNSGFFLRAGLEGRPFPTDVWQVNLKESALGSLMRGSKTVVPSNFPKLPLNQWCKFRMEVSGRKVVLSIDDRRAWEFADLDAPWGYVGLQAEGKAFDFRNLRLQELP
jgi:hypothetical protein